MMVLLEAKGLVKGFRRGLAGFRAVDGVSLSVGQGEFVSLTGRSGSGKTTLLSLLAGLLGPDGGDVLLRGRSIFALGDAGLARLRNREIGFLPQGRSLLGNLTVLDNVRLPFHLARRQGGSRQRALELLGDLSLAHLAGNRPHELSGGELRRVALARALMNSPELVVADEPTGDLDLGTAASLIRLIRDINSRGVAFLVATHDLDLCRGLGRVLEMSGGRLVDGASAGRS
ncbi:MAG: ATP-binding cassette domain-containing protein [Deltaproteobacteria bacterium]|jgi:putative ABC transport system ATP-binding protein|nr:ATP-binding cassette domain-containing protein [Deltaproteobacteria bacterium]